eukprot:1978055-Prymnesium_polylepis.1
MRRRRRRRSAGHVGGSDTRQRVAKRERARFAAQQQIVERYLGTSTIDDVTMCAHIAALCVMVWPAGRVMRYGAARRPRYALWRGRQAAFCVML